MVEYGVNVANKFGYLSDDEVEDPEVMLRRAEALNKKDEKSASQKRMEKLAAAAAKKKKDAVVPVANAPRDTDARRASQTATAPKKDFSRENKENRPESERGRGRGRGRGMVGSRGRGGVGGGLVADIPRFKFDQVGEKDTMGERFGESRGRGRGRGGGGRGRPPFRGGPRGGGGGAGRLFGDENEQNGDEQQHAVVNGNNNEMFGGERQNFNNDFGGTNTYRGSNRGGRGGYRGGDRDSEKPAFRGSRGGRGSRQFDRISGSDRGGMKSVDKKEGFGKGNWGTEQDELNGQNEQLNTTVESEKVDEGLVAVNEKIEEDGRGKLDEDAPAKQLTLDEFKAQMAKRAEPQFNLRQAGEGANDKEFGKLIPLTKQFVDEANDEEIVVVRREPRAKRLDIEINFTDEQRERGGGRGGGGRMRDGGFRGGRGPRGGRDGRGPRQAQIFEVSADAFPALGSQ